MLAAYNIKPKKWVPSLFVYKVHGARTFTIKTIGSWQVRFLHTLPLERSWYST